jgi:hypothetical protein
MTEPRELEPEEPNRPRSLEMPRPRAVGSPLSAGSGGKTAAPPIVEGEVRHFPPPAGPALPPGNEPREEEADSPSNLQRALGGLRTAWPFVQKILPLLDGQVVTAVSNLLAPSRHTAPPVNLVPLETGMAELRGRNTELREHVIAQHESLKRVEDRLDAVREATDRNTLEQQELMEDLKAMGKRANRIAFVVFFLLAASIAMNVVLYLHIEHVLP